MNRNPLLLALQAPLLAAGLAAQAGTGLVGAYHSAKVTAPVVLEAKEAIQKHLAILHLEQIQQASTQVVAGTNVKLLCTVTGDGEPATWEFVIWHRLDGVWQLQSARRE